MYKLIDYTSEKSGGKFLTDFKASLAIIALEFWLVVSAINYYNVYIDSSLNFSKGIYITIAVFIAVINHIIFTHDSKWKNFNKEFDQLSTDKNRKGSWIFFGIILFIICNFIYSIYLLYLDNRV